MTLTEMTHTFPSTDRHKALCKQIRERLPSDFPSYRSPKGYASWPDHVDLCVQSLAWFGTAATELGDEAEQCVASNAAWTLEEALRYAAPAIYLSKELHKSLMNTKIPKLTIDHKIPLERFHLMLPVGALTGYTDPVSICCRIRLSDVGIEWNDGVAHGYSISYTLNMAKAVIPFTCWFSADGTQWYTCPNLERVFDESLYDNNPQVRDDRLWYESLQRYALILIMHTVLIMQYQPELLSTTPAPTAGFGFSEKKIKTNSLPIRWLGRNYRRQRSSSASTGAHASPCAHWRKGHWHHFRYGKGREKLRLKWVEPVFVNS